MHNHSNYHNFAQISAAIQDQEKEKEHCLLSNYVEHVGTGLSVLMSKILEFIITCASRHALIYGVKEPDPSTKTWQALIIFLGL